MSTPAPPGPTLAETLARMDATLYRRWAARMAMRQVMRYLGATDPKLIAADAIPLNYELPHLLITAADAGRITMDEAIDVDSADTVLRDGDGGAYYLAQISLTPDDNAIIRARRRADLLAQAAGVPAHAFVIGAQIPDAIRNLAAAQQVTICIVEDKER